MIVLCSNMSHGKRMKRLGKLDSLLRQNPHGMRIVDIARKLGVDRSTVYRDLESKDMQTKARYERGIAYPVQPKGSTEQKPSQSLRGLGFFGFLEHRAERKRLEKEKDILDLDVEFAARMEEIRMTEDKYNSETEEDRVKRRQKYRRLLSDT